MAGLGTAPATTTTVTDPSTAANVIDIQFQGTYETQRQIYQGSTSGALLQTLYTCYNGATSPCTGTSITLPITQIAAITQLDSSGLQSKHVAFYNSFGLPTEIDEYDYGSGAPQTTPLKKTLISYAPLGNNINAS